MNDDPNPKKPPLWFILTIVAAVAGIVGLTVALFHDGGRAACAEYEPFALSLRSPW